MSNNTDSNESMFVIKSKPDNFKPEDYWAQQVWRVEYAGKSYLCAEIRRRFAGDTYPATSNFDIKTKGIGIPFGFTTEKLYEMITDTDPESPTFNKRIPDVSQQPIGTNYKFEYEVTPENVAMIKIMCGNAPGYNNSTTRFYWLPQGSGKSLPAQSLEELAAYTCNEVSMVLERRYWQSINSPEGINKEKKGRQ